MNKVKIILSSLTVMMMFLIMTEVKADIAQPFEVRQEMVDNTISARLGDDNHLIITFTIIEDCLYEYVIKSYNSSDIIAKGEGSYDDGGVVEETIQHKDLQDGDEERFIVELRHAKQWIQTRYGQKRVHTHIPRHHRPIVGEIIVSQVDGERKVEVTAR